MQLIKLGETVQARKAIAFTAVSSTDMQTRLDASALTFTIRIVRGDGTSAAGAGSGGIGGSGVIQPDSVNALGCCYYVSAAADITVLGAAIVRISAPGMETREIDIEVVAFDPFDAAGLGLTNLATAIATIAANLNATVGSRAQPSDVPSPSTVAAAVDTTLTTAHGAGAWTGGGGGGSIDPTDIFESIVEGPNQIDGGGEVTMPATPDTTFVQAIREFLAFVSGSATGTDGPQTIFKSRGGGRNRIVGSLNNGNRTITSRNNT